MLYYLKGQLYGSHWAWPADANCAVPASGRQMASWADRTGSPRSSVLPRGYHRENSLACTFHNSSDHQEPWQLLLDKASGDLLQSPCFEGGLVLSHYHHYEPFWRLFPSLAIRYLHQSWSPRTMISILLYHYYSLLLPITLAASFVDWCLSGSGNQPHTSRVSSGYPYFIRCFSYGLFVLLLLFLMVFFKFITITGIAIMQTCISTTLGRYILIRK